MIGITNKKHLRNWISLEWNSSALTLILDFCITCVCIFENGTECECNEWHSHDFWKENKLVLLFRQPIHTTPPYSYRTVHTRLHQNHIVHFLTSKPSALITFTYLTFFSESSIALNVCGARVVLAERAETLRRWDFWLLNFDMERKKTEEVEEKWEEKGKEGRIIFWEELPGIWNKESIIINRFLCFMFNCETWKEAGGKPYSTLSTLYSLHGMAFIQYWLELDTSLFKKTSNVCANPFVFPPCPLISQRCSPAIKTSNLPN